MIKKKVTLNSSDTDMKCPVCDWPLKYDSHKRIQSNEEHVMDPNGKPSKKPFYVCWNKQCEMYKTGYGWGPRGDYYGRTINDDDSEIEFDKDIPEAMNSYARKSTVEIRGTGKKTEKDLFRIGKYRVMLKYKYKSNFKGESVKRSSKLTVLKKERGGWLYVHNPFKMLTFSIKSYFQSKNRLTEHDRFHEELHVYYHSDKLYKKVARFFLKYVCFQYKYFKRYEETI